MKYKHERKVIAIVMMMRWQCVGIIKGGRLRFISLLILYVQNRYRVLDPR